MDAHEGARSAAARSDRARSFVAEQASALVGRPLVEAEAAVSAHGLRSKVVPAAGITTLEFGIGRVTLVVDDRGDVTEVRVG